MYLYLGVHSFQVINIQNAGAVPMQYLTDQSKDYIAQLQTRSKWQTSTKNLKVGDLVLLQDESLPRGMWHLGLIKEVKFGRDDLVRSANIKTRSTELVRSVTKLIPLEGDILWEE